MLSCSFRKKTPAMASIPFPLLLLRGPNLPGICPVNGMAMEAWSRLYKERVLNRTFREYCTFAYQSSGCAIRDSAFASTAALEASDNVGPW
ncbi:hypothetical protein ACFX1S_012431 [Malus domestica]